MIYIEDLVVFCFLTVGALFISISPLDPSQTIKYLTTGVVFLLAALPIHLELLRQLKAEG
jgi:hypothetical protein